MSDIESSSLRWISLDGPSVSAILGIAGYTSLTAADGMPEGLAAVAGAIITAVVTGLARHRRDKIQIEEITARAQEKATTALLETIDTLRAEVHQAHRDATFARKDLRSMRHVTFEQEQEIVKLRRIIRDAISSGDITPSDGIDPDEVRKALEDSKKIDISEEMRQTDSRELDIKAVHKHIKFSKE